MNTDILTTSEQWYKALSDDEMHFALSNETLSTFLNKVQKLSDAAPTLREDLFEIEWAIRENLAPLIGVTVSQKQFSPKSHIRLLGGEAA